DVIISYCSDQSHVFRSIFFFTSRRRHTRSKRDWSSDVCSSDLAKDHTASISCERSTRGLDNKAELQRLTLGGKVPGLLAYDKDGPCGWVSVAPREDFIRLSRSRSLRPADPNEPGVWALVCFWLPHRRRRRGLGT